LQLLSRTTHWLFYALLVVLPVLGWIAASGYGANVTLLRLVSLSRQDEAFLAISDHGK